MLSGFSNDECAFLAGAVAYQIFFAIVPLLALALGVLAFVYGADRAQAQVVDLIRGAYPSATDQETGIVRQIVEGRAVSLGLGLVGTLFSVTAIHASIDLSLASVLGREGKRRFVRGKLEAVAFAAGLALLLVVSFGVSYGVQAAQGALAAAGLEAGARLALQLLSPIIGVALGYLFFLLIYRFVPRRPVPRRLAAIAALVAAVLWEVAKVAFGFYTRALGAFAAYGAIAFVAGLLTWIYLTAAIILVGAEVIRTSQASA